MFDNIENFALSAMQSDVFAAGIGLGLIGIIVGFAHVFWMRAVALISRRVHVSVTLDNRTEAYRHLMIWIDQMGVLHHARRVRMTDLSAGDREIMGPAPGTHWFVRDGRLCWFTRELDTKARVGAHHGTNPMETVTITVLFGRVAQVRGWIAEGARLSRARARIGPGLHVFRDDWWDHVGDLPARALETVVSDDDRIERLANDVAQFYHARDWYSTRGVPWRRGYLLFGPPGTGKSSVIRAVASHLNRDIATLDIGRPSLSDDGLREAVFSAPRGAILAMEDIDALFRDRKGKHQSGISFSGLLNAIDGLAAQEGRALFMTTNHLKRLDPALIRPGRADVHVELAEVSPIAARALFLRFFPEEAAYADRFEAALAGHRFTPARLQGWLLETADNPERACTAAGLLPTPTLAAE